MAEKNINPETEEILDQEVPEEAFEEETTESNAEASEETEAAADSEAANETEAEAEVEVEDAPSKKDKKDEKIEELTDRVKRQMAEFDNFRKRTEKEKAQMFETGAKNIIEKILPVIDNFERGLASLSDEEKETPFAQGMDKTYKQMLTALAEAGVKPIEAVGKEFDPNLHNAVMHIEDENLGENTVAQEFQKGYTYRDTVVRFSMVQVAN